MAYAEKRPGAKTWRARYKRPDGTSGSKPGFRTRKLAEDYGEDQEAAIRAGTWIDPQAGETPLAQWWDKWISAQEVRPSTIETYTQHYRQHIAPRWGSVQLGAITPIDLEAWLKDRREHLSASAMNIISSVLRGLLDSAAFNRMIQFSPMPPKKRGRRAAGAEPPREGVVIPLPVAALLLGRMRGDDERLILLVALFTGMRWSEIAAMRASYLTTDAGIVPGAGYYLIDPAIGAVHQSGKSRRYLGPPKSGARGRLNPAYGAGRVMDLPPFLNALLRSRAAQLPKGLDILFANSRGGYRSYGDWNRDHWRPACDGRPASVSPKGRSVREASAPVWLGLHFHDFKHTHASILDDLGTHAAMRNYRLGHAVKGAPGVYSHPTDQMRADVVTGLQSVWDGWHLERSTPKALPSDIEMPVCDNTLF